MGKRVWGNDGVFVFAKISGGLNAFVMARGSIAMRHRRSSIYFTPSIPFSLPQFRSTACIWNTHRQQFNMRINNTVLRQAQRTLRASPQRYEYRPPDFQVDHLVVGGGVIGLACAAKLTTALPEKTTYLVERHSQVCISRSRSVSQAERCMTDRTGNEVLYISFTRSFYAYT